jgi:hypothetical protein
VLREFDSPSLLHQVRSGAVGQVASPPVLKAGKVREIGFGRSTRPGSSSYGELLERQQASLLNWSRWRESRAGSTPALSSDRRTAGSARGKLAVCKTAIVSSILTPASNRDQGVSGCTGPCQGSGADSISAGRSHAPLAERLGICLPSRLTRIRFPHGARQALASGKPSPS